MTTKKGKKFLQDESQLEGHFDKNLWQDLRRFWQRYLPFAILCLIIGSLGRFALLSISVVIGTWADALCTGSTLCDQNAPLFLLSSHQDYLMLAGGLLAFGAIFSGIYLISVASLGAKVTELIHNETVMHVSRYPMNILDRTPVGNIYTRFSSDFNH